MAVGRRVGAWRFPCWGASGAGVVNGGSNVEDVIFSRDGSGVSAKSEVKALPTKAMAGFGKRFRRFPITFRPPERDKS